VSAQSNVVLTGFMGTGKSTIGRLLAHRLGRRFVDTDQLIESRHGPIPEIFASEGEARFREIERDVAAELAAQHDLVIATGGGLLLDPVNAEALGATGTVLCLVASVDELASRLRAGAEHRPLLAGGDLRTRIQAFLDEREAAYGAFTPVHTDGRTPDEVVDVICDLLDAPG